MLEIVAKLQCNSSLNLSLILKFHWKMSPSSLNVWKQRVTIVIPMNCLRISFGWHVRNDGPSIKTLHKMDKYKGIVCREVNIVFSYYIKCTPLLKYNVGSGSLFSHYSVYFVRIREGDVELLVYSLMDVKLFIPISYIPLLVIND